MQSQVISDIAHLSRIVAEISDVNGIKFMRDPTRGGLATTLNEIVEGKNFGIIVEEEKIMISDGVSAVCEFLGLGHLYLANDGKIVVIVKRTVPVRYSKG
ncbi:MAG: AIR synthase-related protein [Thermodesulfobacteriota bacterium]|nr:AIR synthase-related protein [Thermodesulfobacteriota bacterium]